MPCIYIVRKLESGDKLTGPYPENSFYELFCYILRGIFLNFKRNILEFLILLQRTIHVYATNKKYRVSADVNSCESNHNVLLFVTVKKAFEDERSSNGARFSQR